MRLFQYPKLKCRTVPGPIPSGVTGFFSDIPVPLPTIRWPWGRLGP